MSNQDPWWSQAVIYQIYPRSFFDSNGDGEGDLSGISLKIEYLKSLGIDAIWLSPFYQSPNKDGGYDVSDPRMVDPRFGSLADFGRLVDLCHQNSLRVIVDLVPNHFSSEHRWFQEAIASNAGSPERQRFHFRDPNSDGSPPNNWISLFGGSTWSKSPDGQFYLHLFDQSQPDLNWENPEVSADFEETLRFWLDQGVDGFRIDVAHGLVKEEIEKDHYAPELLSDALRLDIEMEPARRSEILATVPFFNRPGVHEIYRKWRRIFDSYDRDVVSVAEIWVHPPEEAALYVRPDELHQVFNFDLLTTPFEAKALFESITGAFSILEPVGALPTWALSNHDSPRVATRLGVLQSQALAIFLLALPGSFYLYNGQELSLPDGDVLDSDRQDPVYFRTQGVQKGRDGARVPLPWSADEVNCGFSSARPWLPIAESWRNLSVESQEKNSGSSLHLFRRALSARPQLVEAGSSITWIESQGDEILAFTRGDFLVLLNTSSEVQEFISEGAIFMASDQETFADGSKISLPPLSACWVARSK
jgi:alpha-glucosidase